MVVAEVVATRLSFKLAGGRAGVMYPVGTCGGWEGGREEESKLRHGEHIKHAVNNKGRIYALGVGTTATAGGIKANSGEQMDTME